MKFEIKNLKFGLLLLFSLCVNAQEAGQEISGFRVPEYDENGLMTSQLFGDHAEFAEGGMVKITTLRVEFYKEGDVFMVVESPWCFYNQKEQKAHSEAPVRADMQGTLLTGMGYKMNSDDRTVHVLRDSKVIVTDTEGQSIGLPTGGGERNPGDETVITSDELFLNYHEKTAYFVSDVHVEDPELKVDSSTLELRFGDNNQIEWIEALTNVHVVSPEMNMDSQSLELRFAENNKLEWLEALTDVRVENPDFKLVAQSLEVRFAEKNEIDWMEALTDVRILHEGREAYCERLIFTGETGEYVLEEEPKLVQGKSFIVGERIRLWRDTQKMVCEPSARLVMYPDGENEMDIFGN